MLPQNIFENNIANRAIIGIIYSIYLVQPIQMFLRNKRSAKLYKKGYKISNLITGSFGFNRPKIYLLLKFHSITFNF